MFVSPRFVSDRINARIKPPLVQAFVRGANYYACSKKTCKVTTSKKARKTTISA
jgi:hypothetical protein